MRADESAYWDKEADNRAVENIRDNVWKRQEIMARLYKENWTGERVLEIGVGTATAAAALQLTCLAVWDYVGTDVSKTFCEWAAKRFKLNVFHTDILELPPIEGGYTRVICLDSLEHVKPEDRGQGYANIGSLLAPHAKMLINMPLEETSHDLQYDFPFDLRDIQHICDETGLRLISYEEYEAVLPKMKRKYGWVVLEK